LIRKTNNFYIVCAWW